MNEPLIAVITTGGTIASRKTADGSSTPSLDGQALLSRLPNVPQVRLRVIDLLAMDSSALRLADMQAISDAVGQQLQTGASGVVVLHGTDAMEETALLLTLQHPGATVVLTGAQFADDHPLADGPQNMAAAIRLAAEGTPGIRIAFGGRVLPAWGLVKYATDSADAFRRAAEDREPDISALIAPVSGIRVDVVAVHPGCDDLHITASLAAGAQGIVLAALGSGNANAQIVNAVALCHKAGVPVVVSSRVPVGHLAASYGGGGGGHDLVRAGAILSTLLRPGQARILLAALIASGRLDRAGALFAPDFVRPGAGSAKGP